MGTKECKVTCERSEYWSPGHRAKGGGWEGPDTHSRMLPGQGCARQGREATKGLAPPASPAATGCQGNPLLNWHQGGGVFQCHWGRMSWRTGTQGSEHRAIGIRNGVDR